MTSEPSHRQEETNKQYIKVHEIKHKVKDIARGAADGTKERRILPICELTEKRE